MAPRSARTYAKRLVRDHAREAIEFLVRRCDDKEFFIDMVECIEHQAQIAAHSPQHVASMSLTPERPVSPVGSQHSNSSRTAYKLPDQHGAVVRRSVPLGLHTPISSTDSQSSKDISASGEWVYFFTHQGRGPEEVLLRLRTAQVQYSMIREDVVCRKYLSGDKEALQPLDMYITRTDTPLVLEKVRTKCRIELVWRRPHSNRSRQTIFYVVPGDALDTDVLLGYQDSEHGHPNELSPITTESQGGHDISAEEEPQVIRHAAPTTPLQSIHPSDYPHESNAYPPQVRQQQRHTFLQGLAERQATLDEETRHSQNSPTPTVLGSRSVATEKPQTLGPSPFASMDSTAAHNGGRSSGTDKIRLNITWDKAPINISLDMAAPPENFYLAFRTNAEKRRRPFERDSVSIWLRRDKQMDECDGYELFLNESDLAEDWETTLSWLKENRRDTAPHLIGRVEIDGG